MKNRVDVVKEVIKHEQKGFLEVDEALEIVNRMFDSLDLRSCEKCKHAYEHDELQSLCCDKDVCTDETLGVGIVTEDFWCCYYESK